MTGDLREWLGCCVVAMGLSLAACSSSKSGAAGIAGAIGGAVGAGGATSSGGSADVGGSSGGGGIIGGGGAVVGPAGGGGGGVAGAPGAGDVFTPTAGDWAGTTSQNERFAFTIDASGITFFRLDYDGTACSAGLGGVKLDGTPVALIANEQFRTDTTLTDGNLLGSYSIAGTFTSASTASGTFNFALTALDSSQCGGSGSGSWTAAPAPPTTDGGAGCVLSQCSGSSSIAFTYSCASPNSTYESSSDASGSSLTVTYDNGHSVHCVNGTVNGAVVQMCSDDTGAVCSLAVSAKDAGMSALPACAGGVAQGVACGTSGDLCALSVDAGPQSLCHCTTAAGATPTWTCPMSGPPMDAGAMDGGPGGAFAACAPDVATGVTCSSATMPCRGPAGSSGVCSCRGSASGSSTWVCM